MAEGDAAGLLTATVADQAYFNIQPGAGIEWCIHNIAHGANCTLYLTNGTTYIQMDTGTGAGAWINQTYFVSNTLYVAVKNTSGGNADFGCIGVITKATA